MKSWALEYLITATLISKFKYTPLLDDSDERHFYLCVLEFMNCSLKFLFEKPNLFVLECMNCLVKIYI